MSVPAKLLSTTEIHVIYGRMDQAKKLLSKRKFRRLEEVGVFTACLLIPVAMQCLASRDPLHVIRSVFSPIFLAALGGAFLAFLAGFWVNRLTDPAADPSMVSLKRDLVEIYQQQISDSDLNPKRRTRVAPGE